MVLKKIAVTGGLQSGKSTLCQMFQEWGATTVSLDQIVHQLISQGKDQNKELVEQIIALLGDEIKTDGTIDRKKVAHIVFQNPQKLATLEALIHPVVRKELFRLYEKAVESRASLFVVEEPLLFELENSFPIEWYDATIAISCPEEIAISRSHLSADEYKKRMKQQLSQQEKQARATFYIDNQGTKDMLYNNAQAVFHKISKLQGE